MYVILFYNTPSGPKLLLHIFVTAEFFMQPTRNMWKTY